MTRPLYPTDSKAVIVADASVMINLNATGYAERIIQALPNRLIMPEIVAIEFNQGITNGYQDGLQLAKLIADGNLDVVGLCDIAGPYFSELVAGSTSDTLDDGEAATIACALAKQGVAAIDEKKANRISSSRFPSLPVIATVDLLAHPAVEAALGKQQLADSVYQALTNARMRVLLRHTEWVVNLIGIDRATLCTSLPASVRTKQRAQAGNE